MKIQEIMTRNVEIIAPSDNVQEAAKKMESLNVGSLPVCDSRRLVGVITDRDIAIRAVAKGQNPGQAKVSDTMTPNLIYCYEDQEVEEAAKLMERHQIRRLPILNRDKSLVGIVALGDLAVDGSRHVSGEVLEGVSEPAKPQR